MNRKVFLSILAMDSYQRGYAPGEFRGHNTGNSGDTEFRGHNTK
jgi:hypothetical protein